MKKLAIMSDLHIDLNHWGTFEIETLCQVLQATEVTHLHLAGDTANHFYTVAQPFLEQVSQVVALSYGLGNHDMLDVSEDERWRKEGETIDLGTHVLISLTGWYDYQFEPNMTSAVHQSRKAFYWFDRLITRFANDIEVTNRSIAVLEGALARTTKPTIVAMHMVPHAQFTVSHPFFERFNAYLGSPRFHEVFVNYGVKDVVFGHLHHRHDCVIDGVHYQARPLGYQREWQLVRQFFEAYPQYRIEQMYHLTKRYRVIKDLPEYRAFYRQHFADELRQAMSVFVL